MPFELQLPPPEPLDAKIKQQPEPQTFQTEEFEVTNVLMTQTN